MTPQGYPTRGRPPHPEEHLRRRPEALDAIDKVTQREPGRPEKSANSRHLDETSHRGGTTRDYAPRRLRKDRPDLHAKALAGELSAN
jgi:hypothetical protein